MLRNNIRCPLMALAMLSACVGVTRGAELSVSSLAMPPDSTVTLAVSGDIAGESTFGVTILVELIPRAGATGTLEFTPALPIDILQLGDPWPGLGTFSVFDTDPAGSNSPFLNATFDDDGEFIGTLVTFTGDLSGFPIVSNLGASGVWDVVLSTSAGDSSWEGLVTTLIAGTVTVTPGACLSDAECDDFNLCTDDACIAGACVNANNTVSCNDSDLCTTSDTCSGGSCVGTSVDCTSLDDQCNLGVCNAGTGACEAQPINEGFACDDGDLCSVGDVCVIGVCTASPTDCTGLDDQCNVGVCNVATGICEAQPINGGLACDDGLFCSTGETCALGVCGGSVPTDCSAQDDQCNTGVCNEGTDVCDPQPINEGFACDDGLFCTTGETCTLGACNGGGVTDCTGFDDQCNLGVCNEGTNLCEAQSANELLACDDGLFCTTGETCALGVCNGGVLTDCTAFDDQCNLGVCNEAINLCEAQTINEGFSCDDGLFCTSGETCVVGICGFGFATDCTVFDDQCNLGVCNEATDACEALATNEGLSCDDGLFCTTGEFCTAGTCGSGGLTDCTAFTDQCNLGVCNEATDVCEAQPANEGLGCDDGDLCTISDTCSLGVCTSVAVDCSSLDDQCNLGVCNAINGLCEAQPANEGLVCDDGDLCSTGDSCTSGVCTATPVTCTGGDTCDPADGVCKSCLSDIDCDDSNLCTDDTCVLGLCVHADNVLPCNDSDLCTTGDTCSAGVCVGAAVDCTSLDDQCNLGVCNAGTGICEAQAANEAAACNDGLFCTTGETCSLGVCGGGGLTDCSGLDDQCNVGVCNETTDACESQSINEGFACNDGLFCTTGETCTLGVCDGGGLTDCTSVDDQCNVGVCNEATNVCDPQPANESLACDDGLFCTTGETCTLGVCGGGSATDCSAFDDQCNLGTCNEATDVCEPQPANETVACDDGLFCTSGETCTAGVCGTGSSTNCSAFDDQCNVGVCNEATNVCEAQPASEGAFCDDGNFCTVNETCTLGVCNGGAGRDCSFIDGQCTVGVCNETTDACESQSANEGAACNDGQFCTTGETCALGLCTGGSVTDCSAAGDQCNVGTCNETTNTCDPQPANEGLACDDGVFCTAGELCSAGTCGGGGTTDCSIFDDQCNVGVCNPVFDLCEPLPINEGIACDDGTFCTSGEACTLGVCGGGATTDCSSLDDQCNFGVCNVVSDACEPQPANELLGCDDGLFCTSGETCTLGVCGGGGPTDCAAVDDQCNVGVCNEVSNACEPQSANEGIACNDGFFCTTGETCTLGACGGGGVTDCSAASDQCNTGVCNETSNVCEPLPTNEGLPCDDGLFCNTGETCSAGVCGSGGATDCTAFDDQCNLGVCNEGTDVCEAQPANELLACDDGLFCTTGETCTLGACDGGGPTDCSSSTDQCNLGVCNETSNACEPQPANELLACDDGLFCTTGETCTLGVCNGGALTDCTAQDDQCNVGVCNEAANSCDPQPINEGLACNDSLFCTTGETCVIGVCGAGAATDCSSFDDQCNLGVCNETADLCEAQPSNEGLACDDGLFCTTGETCTLGACDGGALTDCTALDDSCLVGVCNEGLNVCEAQPTNEGLACDDGLFCSGTETCTLGVCISSGDPCTGGGELCNEGSNTCGACLVDSDCNDGLFCTGTESCIPNVAGNFCLATGDPCTPLVCDDTNDLCIPPPRIVELQLFYNGQFGDAPDPTPAFMAAGSLSTISNVTNYIHGITGIRVVYDDIVSYATIPDAAFTFEWTTGSGTIFTPVTDAALNITFVQSVQGLQSVLDITIVNDHIRKRWLRVTIDAAQVTTGGVALDGELSGNPLVLPSGDGLLGGNAVFAIGSQAGDVDGDGRTILTDVGLIRLVVNPFTLVPITNINDVDKDGRVLLNDVGAARLDVNPFFALPPITP